MRVNAYSYALLIKLLHEGALTRRELADETGLHYSTVLDYVRELHKAKMVHIVSWEADNMERQIAAIFKLGRGTDAVRKPLTPYEKIKRYRKRQKQKMLASVMNGTARFVKSKNNHYRIEAAMTTTMSASAASPGVVACSGQIEKEINEMAASPTH